MIIPVRCFTCGRVVAGDYEKFKQAVAAGKDPGATMHELGVERYCCRRMILSQVDLLPEAARYE